MSNMFDPLITNAWELQELLEQGKVTSTTLVELYLDQIERHDQSGLRIRAMLTVVPKDALLKTANALDDERRSQGVRGPLHGIPVIIKDTFNSPSIQVDTTCGTTALRGAKAREDAAVVKKIIEAGMIILGKTNLTELNNFKGRWNIAGWSAAGGQTRSPYVRGDISPVAPLLGHSTPSGSSSGSCAGTAAGFAPVAFGTETYGSVIQPAARAALFALKVTPRSADTTGICPGNPDFDALGAMSKSALDIINLWNVIFAPHNQFDIKKDQRPWSDLKVGFVDGKEWQPADFVTEPHEGFKKQSLGEMDTLIDRVESLGARTVRNTELPKTPDEFFNLGGRKFATAMESYLGLFEDPPVRNLSDIVRWNLEHADEELPTEQPSQEQLEDYVSSPMAVEDYDKTLNQIQRDVCGGVIRAFEDNDVDVIFAPGDSIICSVAALAGCPAANVPLGYADFNGRAHGLNMIARPMREHDLLRVMRAWEVAFPELRQPPPMLVGLA